MNINVEEIIANKMKQMEQDKTIENLIVSTLEKTIKSEIESSINCYDVTSLIRNELKKSVADSIEDVGLSAYNTMIANAVRELINVEMKNDLQEKITAQLENLLLKKRKSIKLSEIIQVYKDGLDEDEDYTGFSCEITGNSDGTVFEHLKIKVKDKDDSDNNFCISIIRYRNEGYTITDFNSEKLNLGWLTRQIPLTIHLSDFEALCINLINNKTEIELDMNDGEIEEELFITRDDD